jgi:hypothetical protein
MQYGWERMDRDHGLLPRLPLQGDVPCEAKYLQVPTLLTVDTYLFRGVWGGGKPSVKKRKVSCRLRMSGLMIEPIGDICEVIVISNNHLARPLIDIPASCNFQNMISSCVDQGERH